MPGRTLHRRGPVLGVAAAMKRQQVVTDLAAKVPVDGDQPLAVSREKFAIDAWLVIKPGEIRLAAQLEHVLPADAIFGEQHQVIAPFAPAAVGAIGAGLAGGCDIRLDAKDGLDAFFLARGVKGDRPEDVPVIGDGARLHSQFGHARDELLDLVAAI